MILEKYNHQFLLLPAFGIVKETYNESVHSGKHIYLVFSWLCFGLIIRWFDIINSNEINT